MQQEIPARLTTLVSKCFPGWKVEECIGKGSYSRVYRIRQKDGVGSDSALKWVEYSRDSEGIAEILNRGASDKDVAEYLRTTKNQLQREIQAMDRLRGNSYIVNMDDHQIVDREDGGFDLLIRMEYVTPLPALTAEMTVQDVRQVGLDICSALIDCEKEGISHRDIKPANIFRNRQGRYKLGDFGVAKLRVSQRESTPQGTPLYMAPEVYQSKAHDSKKADLYSLGLVLYELLNVQHPPFTPMYGRLPTIAEEEESVRQRMSGKDLPSPQQGSRELNLIIHRACSVDPEDRYDSAEEMFEELQALDLQSVGQDRLKSLSDLPSAPAEEQNTASRDAGRDSKQTEKSSPSDTNPVGRAVSDNQGGLKHPLYSVNDADADEPEPEKKDTKGFEVKDVIERQKKEKEEKEKKRKKQKAALIAIGIALVVLAGIVALMLLTGQISSLKVTQNGTEATFTWSGGSGPWEVAVFSGDKEIRREQVRDRKAVFTLAPGFDYTFQVANQKTIASMKEMPAYSGSSIALQWVKLQHYLVKAGGAVGVLKDTERIEYYPLIGTEGEKGYLMRIGYKMPSGEDTQAMCFLISDGYQEILNIAFTKSEFLHFGDVSLNDALLALRGNTTSLQYKIYVDGMLLADGKYTIDRQE